MLYLVTQHPKPKYRHCMSSSAVIIDAPNAAFAIRKAIADDATNGGNWFAKSLDCCNPRAEPLKLDSPFKL